jgi:hypothetical protein
LYVVVFITQRRHNAGGFGGIYILLSSPFTTIIYLLVPKYE